jgi:hypothetical protein
MSNRTSLFGSGDKKSELSGRHSIGANILKLQRKEADKKRQELVKEYSSHFYGLRNKSVHVPLSSVTKNDLNIRTVLSLQEYKSLMLETGNVENIVELHVDENLNSTHGAKTIETEDIAHPIEVNTKGTKHHIVSLKEGKRVIFAFKPPKAKIVKIEATTNVDDERPLSIPAYTHVDTSFTPQKAPVIVPPLMLSSFTYEEVSGSAPEIVSISDHIRNHEHKNTNKIEKTPPRSAPTAKHHTSPKKDRPAMPNLSTYSSTKKRKSNIQQTAPIRQVIRLSSYTNHLVLKKHKKPNYL